VVFPYGPEAPPTGADSVKASVALAVYVLARFDNEVLASGRVRLGSTGRRRRWRQVEVSQSEELDRAGRVAARRSR
jgi:hypothetical protein